MTNEELQTVVAAVIQALKTNGKTIAQLTPVTSLANSDSLEVSGGKKIAFSKLKELVASAVVVTEESIKSWVVIESTDDLPEEPTPEEQMKAYVLADESTLYVYVGEGGDTLGGKYKSVDMKGPKGNPGTPLGETEIVDDLDSDAPDKVLSARQGKRLKEMIGSKTFTVVDDLETGGRDVALSAEQGKELKGMIDNVGVKYGTYAEALEAVLASNSVFEWLLVDEVDNSDLIKPLWHINGSLVDAAGAVVSLATLTAPVFSRDSGDVTAGTTLTITCPSGSTLYYSVNGIAATSTSNVTITINEACVVKAYLKNGDAVSDIVAKSYGIAVDHRFQFKIKLTGDNSTEYVPVVFSNSPKYTMTVDWGDGSPSDVYENKVFKSNDRCSHTYSGTAGTEFTITLRGSAIPYLAFGYILSNQSALVAILDNTLECSTRFSHSDSIESGVKDCTSLSFLSANAFQNSIDTNIPLRGCTSLISFEDGFFANIKNLTSCEDMFYGLTAAITSSQWNEIKNMIKDCTSFKTMFYNFDNENVTLPDDLFSKVVVSITNMQGFAYGTAAKKLYGDAYALYFSLLSKVSQDCVTTNAFSRGTATNSTLSNRDQVPSAWGGTGS